MIAEVIIQSNVKNLNKIFDYEIPYEIEDKINIGSRVFVPLGNMKKLENGFVVGIKPFSEYKVKEIASLQGENILDNEKISFIDLFVEIFKLEENINKNLAEYWKDKISIFVEDNNLSYGEFHELYKKEGGQMGIQTIKNWLKGRNISTRDYKNDLLYLSKVMDDDFLLNNIDIMGEEFRKIKAMHIAMGRNLKVIMKGIIVDDFSLNYDSLSLEEQTMHNIIKNSVYQVISVK